MAGQVHVAQELVPRLGAGTPQPVALALGRVVRSVGAAERLEACIKAAEVIARYVAVTALASAASTRDAAEPPPAVENFAGNLSFGVFENAARASTSVGWPHPLREPLRLCLKSTKKSKAIAGQRLQAFVELRNELGHSLTPVDEAKARALIEKNDPVGALIDVLDGLGTALSSPLLVVLAQEHRRGRFIARVAFFSGEGEPIPQELELQDPIFDWEVPYLCTPEGLIPLAPGVLYQPRSSDGRFGLFLLDAIENNSLRYKSVVDSSTLTRAEGVQDIAVWVQVPFELEHVDPAERPLLEQVAATDGRSLHQYLTGGEPPRPRANLQDAQPSRAEAAAPEARAITTLRDFERQANNSGLGTTYRDIVYFFAERGAAAEINDQTVRIVTSGKTPRVLATIEVTSDKELSVALLLGAITSGRSEETEQHSFRTGQHADALLERVAELLAIDENHSPPTS